MRQEVMRWMRNGRVVEMVYMDRNGVISKRRVKLMKLQGDRLVGWDVKKQARRTFCMDRVLACLPTIERATGREEEIG
ncbi:hypothetical protein [Exiguobacterium aurantiacum]|uniref:WYL domain-containing protein n=1 Tax=Exiguobacterium aurantiacum TaxID=33987 RepID=A0ABY5FPQ9_9BACL|nr:hypothetical protein [Exiguobacterium aurantiacum]UTT43202.1 hypothetical protein NMQ00_01500 [Exiguobacterium aurantiacum]